MASMWQSLNDNLAAGVAEWNIYTTLLIAALLAYILYPAFFSPDPDLHPLLLARQSAPSRVRQPGESAVFRSLDTPHSYPLRSGLNVKDPGQPRWQPGRDGDLRDIWRAAVRGKVVEEGKKEKWQEEMDKGAKSKGEVKVVLGKEEVITYQFEALSKEVVAVGKYLQSQNSKRVGICLANSVELVVGLFACAFYGMTPILLPTNQPLEELAMMLSKTQADTLLVGAGAIPLTDLAKLYSGLKQVVWVVARTSRHMDWHEVPEGEGGKTGVAVWHEIMDESSEKIDLPAEIPGGEQPTGVVMIVPNKKTGMDVVEYSQSNIAAAISAQIAVLPHSYASAELHNFSPKDTILSLAPLTDIYPLVLTLAALYSNVSLALNAVTGPQAAYDSAFLGVLPSILIAPPQTLLKMHDQKAAALTGLMGRYMHGRTLETLKSGSMPKTSYVGRDARLIYTYETPNSQNSVLTADQLNSIRAFTGARVIYAHTAAQVAGAVCQTNMLDYQSNGLNGNASAHIGPPLSCLEIRLKAMPGQEVDDEKPTGKPVVSGPAVVKGEAVIDEVLTMTMNNTFAHA